MSTDLPAVFACEGSSPHIVFAFTFDARLRNFAAQRSMGAPDLGSASATASAAGKGAGDLGRSFGNDLSSAGREEVRKTSLRSRLTAKHPEAD